jgi:hypothetical protein
VVIQRSAFPRTTTQAQLQAFTLAGDPAASIGLEWRAEGS